MQADRRTLLLGVAGVVLAALAVRLLWLPDWSRFLAPVDGAWPPGGAFDGHERGYVRAFLGQPPDPSTQAWPLLTGLYQGLGLVFDDPRVLVLLNSLAGAAACAMAALWTARRFGLAAGLWTGLLVAVLPEHAAWSTSAYNVMMPHALLVAGFLARGRLTAFLLLALAVSMRGELALLAVFAGLPGLLTLPLAAAWFHHLGTPELGDPLLALQLNLPLLRLTGPPVLLLGLLSLGDRRTWPVAGFVLASHVVAACFMDMGARHVLAGGVAACVLVGVAASRWRHLPGLLALVGLLLATHDLAGRWYSQAPLPRPDLPPPPAACLELTEEPPIAGQPMPSHVLFWSGQLVGDCLLWGETAAHRAWSSRGLHDRALRMRTLYRLQPVGWRDTPGGGVLLHQLERRW